MGGETDGAKGGGRSHRVRLCGLAAMLTIAGGADTGAAALSRSALWSAGPEERGRQLVAAGRLTFSVRDVEAAPGDATPLAIRVPSAAELRAANAEEGTFLLIRNIPDGVSVSAGMAMGRSWVVPLRQTATLQISCEPGVHAPFQLGFQLIGPDKHVLAETKIIVTLHPPRTVVSPAPVPISPGEEVPTAAVPPPVERDGLSGQAESILLARGTELLGQGGIAAARLIFEELASHGSAAGALALARSYDPAFIPRSAASAPAPDLAEARKWYERAAGLGNPDAKRRLAELVSGQ